jgi:O-antigen biosynthesis protein WbqP
MNFIGPRPALYNEYELINKRELLGINNLKPGITGWAQVNGRDYLTNEIKCKYDKEYLDKQSFIFNMRIFLFTFWAVAKPIYMYFKRKF